MYLKWWKPITKNTLPSKPLVQIRWRNQMFIDKQKRVQHHQASFTTNAEGTPLDRKEKATTRNRKIMNGKAHWSRHRRPQGTGNKAPVLWKLRCWQQKSKITQTGEKICCVLDCENQYCQSHYTTQGRLLIQCNTYQISNDIFHRTRTKI